MNRYALLGRKLGHSYSKLLHEYLFKKNDIIASYDLIEIEKEDLPKVMKDLKNGIYLGYNVTIPYKEDVLTYLDYKSKEVLEIGACNTIKNVNGKLYGYNTDYYGFIEQLKLYNIDVKNKKAFVLGSGGASKAVTYALKELGALVTVVSRTKGYTYQQLKEEIDIDILVNTTPLGMYPDINMMPVDNDIIEKAIICIDVIFNPRVTLFLKTKGQKHGGLPMLIYQAIKAEEIWFKTNIKYDLEEIGGILDE